MYIGRQEVLLAMDLQFARDTSADALARTIDAIERQIGTRFPVIKRIYVEAQVELETLAGARDGGPAASSR